MLICFIGEGSEEAIGRCQLWMVTSPTLKLGGAVWTRVTNWLASWLDQFRKAPPTLLLPFLVSSIVASIFVAIGTIMARSIHIDPTLQVIIQITAYVLAAAFGLFSLLHLWFALVLTYQWLRNIQLIDKAKTEQATAELDVKTKQAQAQAAEFQANRDKNLRQAKVDRAAAARSLAEETLWRKVAEAIETLPASALRDPAIRMVLDALQSRSAGALPSPGAGQGLWGDVVEADQSSPAYLLSAVDKYKRGVALRRALAVSLLIVFVAGSGVAALSPVGQHVGLPCHVFCR